MIERIIIKISVHHGQGMVNSVHNRERLGGGRVSKRKRPLYWVLKENCTFTRGSGGE